MFFLCWPHVLSGYSFRIILYPRKGCWPTSSAPVWGIPALCSHEQMLGCFPQMRTRIVLAHARSEFLQCAVQVIKHAHYLLSSLLLGTAVQSRPQGKGLVPTALPSPQMPTTSIHSYNDTQSSGVLCLGSWLYYRHTGSGPGETLPEQGLGPFLNLCALPLVSTPACLLLQCPVPARSPEQHC